MKKHLWVLAFAFVLLLFALPGTAMAADANGDGYHDGDVAVINDMIENNGLTDLTKGDPAGWGKYVTWDSGAEKRVTQLKLEQHTTLTGALDVSGLTNLTYLACSSTSITELNISTLANLTYLWCGATDIDALNVANLTKLTNLNCSDTNISTLDVANLINLTELYCGTTSISELDVTNLVNLTRLDCSRTNISELDVTNLVNLTNLYCSYTNISELDVAKLIKLQSLGCHYTDIDNLDVTSLTNLTSLTCYNTNISKLNVSGLINLQILTCELTNISELDVTKLSNLKQLRCHHTRINELDLTGLTKLSTLTAYNNEYISFTNPAGQTLTVRKAGSGTGKIVMTAYDLASGSVTLRATADEGSSFTGWTVQPEGATANGNQISFTIDKDMTVEATFDVPVSVSGVNVSPDIASVKAGETQQFTAVVEGTGSYAQTVTWSVSGNTSADTTIDAGGMLSVGADETADMLTVTATSTQDTEKYGTAIASIESEVTYVSLSPASASLRAGETQQFTVTVSGTGSYAQSVTWSVSGNTSAATEISADGLLSVGADEKADALTVTATSTQDAGVSGTASVSVVAEATGVRVSPASASLKPGETQQFSATVEGTGNYAQTVTWSVSGNTSADTKIDSSGFLSVDEKETADTLTVTAVSTEDNSKFGTATVKLVSEVSGVRVSPTSASLKPGETQQFSAAVEGAGNYAQSVIWSMSGNSSAATKIDAGGLLTTGEDEMAESLTVTAVSTEDESVNGTAAVTMLPDLTGVKLSPPQAQIKPGGKQKFVATMEGKGNLKKDVEWSVSGATSANTKIDADGELTVGANEKADTLVVKAVSKAEPDKGGTAVVTVKYDTPAYTVSGLVKAVDTTPMEGVSVALRQGDNTLDTATTDADGGYSFRRVPAGLYNVVASTTDGRVRTSLAEMEDHDIEMADIVMPEGKTNSSVEVEGADTPDVVAGGLDELFEGNDGVYTAADKQVVEAGGSVEFTLKVKKKTNNEIPVEHNLIEGHKGRFHHIELYLDLRVGKEVKDKHGKKDNVLSNDALSDTGRLLTIVVPLPPGLQGKADYVVYRVHNGQPEQLPVSGGGTEGYSYDEKNNAVIIYARLYSVYALGYAEKAAAAYPARGYGYPYGYTVAQGSRPVILSPAQPVTVSAAVGGSYTLSVDAQEASVYKWQVNRNDGKGFVDIPGANGASYSAQAGDAREDGWQFRCIVSNTYGSETSPLFTLRVVSAALVVPPTGGAGLAALPLLLGAAGLAAGLRRRRR